MVKGIGVDIVEINRLKLAMQRRRRFLDKIFTPQEQVYCLSKSKPHLHFAVRFAAKEAVLKAFGTGFRGGIRWTDLEINHDSLGKPSVQLKGAAAEKAKEQGIDRILISLSFNHDKAVASAIALERE